MNACFRRIAGEGLLLAVASLSALAQTERRSAPSEPIPQPDVKTVAPPVVKSAGTERPERAALPAPTWAPKDAAGAPSAGPDRNVIHFQSELDGSLWVRGADYKLRFDSSGASFVPFFSSDAPRNFPVEFSLAEVRSASGALELWDSVLPTRSGDRVVFERGAVSEIYVLEPRGVEQQFLLSRLPGSGDVELQVAVRSELAAEATLDGIEFRNEWGAVRYGRATAIDAAGRSWPLASRLAEGAILITLPAELVAQAALPILVDPVISTFSVEIGTINSLSPDVAYDSTGGNVMYCWEEIFSAGDDDVYTEVRDRYGNLIAGSSAYVDYTSENWTHPRIAFINATDTFLVVSSRNTAAVGREIWGRSRGLNPATISAKFLISGAESGDKINPDVGGDPFGSAPSYFLVVWERVFTATDHDIHARTVKDDGTVSATIYIDNSGATLDAVPSVSKSNSTSNWIVVWQREASATDHDLYGSRLSWSGVIQDPVYAIDTTTWDDANPSVSSVVPGTLRYMVAFDEDWGPDNDISTWAMDGVLNQSFMDLSAAEGSYNLQDQRWPSIEYAGDHFLCSYSELYSTSATDYDVYAADIVWIPGLYLGPTEGHVNLAYSSAPETESQVGAEFGSGSYALTRDSTIVWHRGQTSFYTSDDIFAGRYSPGCSAFVPYCTAGVSSNGCTALMAFGGTPSASAAAGFALGAVNVEGQKNGLIFYGISGPLASPWGTTSSFLCVKPPTQRMDNRPSGGTAGACNGVIAQDWNTFMWNHPVALGQPLHAGQVFFAQCWYRDPPSPKTTNLSDAAWFVVCP